MYKRLISDKKQIKFKTKKKIGKGAAGEIYKIEDAPYEVFKLYNDDILTKKSQEYKDKISLMIENPPDLKPVIHNNKKYPITAWPQEIVVNETNKEFKGFIMPEINLKASVTLQSFLVNSLRTKKGLDQTLNFRIGIARNLTSLVYEIHQLNYFIIDLKPMNLQVYKKLGYVILLDCDGISINIDGKSFPAGMVTTEYTPKPNIGKKAHEFDNDESLNQDCFALSTIIFQLLNNGIHPFSFKPNASSQETFSLIENIKNERYVYSEESFDWGEPSPRSIHFSFPDTILNMFTSAFRDHNPPTALEWYNELCKYTSDEIFRCENDDNHFDFGKGCGYCEIKNNFKSQTSQVPVGAFKKTKPQDNNSYQQTTSSPKNQINQNFQNQQSNSSSASSFWILFLIAVIIGFFWFLINNEDTTSSDPPIINNPPIQDISCDYPYIKSGKKCIIIPSNAIPDGRGGWLCASDYYQNNNACLMKQNEQKKSCDYPKKKSGNKCILIPKNAIPDGRGSWICSSEYYKSNNKCFSSKPSPQPEKPKVKEINLSNGKYEGEYNNQNIPHGRGKLIYKTNDIYEGYFQNGIKNGQGKFISKNFTYIGRFARDKFNGKGTIIYKNGDTYEGGFLDGIKHDEKGLYIYSNGRREIKKWVKGQPKCSLFGLNVECIQDTLKFMNDENPKFIPY